MYSFLEHPTLFASWMIPWSAFELMRFSLKRRYLFYARSKQSLSFVCSLQ